MCQRLWGKLCNSLFIPLTGHSCPPCRCAQVEFVIFLLAARAARILQVPFLGEVPIHFPLSSVEDGAMKPQCQPVATGGSGRSKLWGLLLFHPIRDASVVTVPTSLSQSRMIVWDPPIEDIVGSSGPLFYPLFVCYVCASVMRPAQEHNEVTSFRPTKINQ